MVSTKLDVFDEVRQLPGDALASDVSFLVH